MIMYVYIFIDDILICYMIYVIFIDTQYHMSVIIATTCASKDIYIYIYNPHIYIYIYIYIYTTYGKYTCAHGLGHVFAHVFAFPKRVNHVCCGIRINRPHGGLYREFNGKTMINPWSM